MRPNKLRWVCEERGCFNVRKRPKIEIFADCFPRGINFGDVDMLVEIGGHLLFGEWKSSDASLSRGQALLHQALLEFGHTVALIVGDAETMAISSFEMRFGAIRRPHADASLDELKDEIRRWADWADRNPMRSKRAA